MKKIELSAKTKKIFKYVGGSIAVVGAVAGTVYLCKHGKELKLNGLLNKYKFNGFKCGRYDFVPCSDDSVMIFEGLDKTGKTVASLVINSDFNYDEIGTEITFMDDLGFHFTTETVGVG